MWPVRLLIDGIEFKGQTLVVAPGVAENGLKHLLAVAGSHGKRHGVHRAAGKTLVARGLKQERRYLFVLDGSKALHAGQGSLRRRNAMKLPFALAGILLVLIYATNAGAQHQARTDIQNAQGKSIGTASLREPKDGVVIAVSVNGLPQGLHAVHLRAVGKCEGPAFTSAGPHFNPLDKKHGLQNSAGPHAGDLPDMYVQKNGVGRYEVLTDNITLGSGETSIFDGDGTTLIIH